MKLNRREVLVGGAAAVAAACGSAPPKGDGPRPIFPDEYDHATPTDFSPDALPENGGLFPMGVQAGAMRQDGALLWTFVEGAAAVRLRVWRDTDEVGTVALAKDVDVSPDAAGYLKVPVDGLAPATWYRYGFFHPSLSQRSLLGRFRTAFPDDWREPITLGGSACTNFRMQPYRALRYMARQPLDAFVHLGDISYNDSASVLADFRRLWRRTLTDAGYRELLSSTGWYATWDDHEIANDLNPETADPLRIATGKQAFFESLPVEKGEQGQLWRSYRWGGTAELFLLDCRTERRPSTIGTAEATYVSRAQLEWLKGALEQSSAHFKIVLNSVPITLMPPPLWGNQNDRWQGYAAQRDELLSFIVEREVRNVWFLSGDFHMGLVMRVEKEGPRNRLWEIACGPGGNGNNPLALVWDSPQNREVAFPKAQFEYASGQVAATLLTFDPKDDSVRVRFVDPDTESVRYDAVLREGG